MTDAQATFARATLEYDKAHERALMEAITESIFETSRVSDCNAVVIRTGEAAQALLTALACVLAMSPSVARSPASIRKTCDDFSKSLRRKVSAAEQNLDLQEFIRRTFRRQRRRRQRLRGTAMTGQLMRYDVACRAVAEALRIDESREEVIKSRPVGKLAAKDCVLWMWTTNQHLRIAMAVMEAWGFEYKSNYVWVKNGISTGRWNRSRHEILLIGTRGNPVCPAAGTQWDSAITSPRLAHSEKPKCFLEMIEQYFPNVPKIELNCRGKPRPGWDAWGNEVEEAAE